MSNAMDMYRNADRRLDISVLLKYLGSLYHIMEWGCFWCKVPSIRVKSPKITFLNNEGEQDTNVQLNKKFPIEMLIHG